RTILISDDRFRIQIEAECRDLETHIRGHDKNTYQAVGEVVTKLGLKDVGVEASGVTLEEFEKLGNECKTPIWSADLASLRNCARSRTKRKSRRSATRFESPNE